MVPGGGGRLVRRRAGLADLTTDPEGSPTEGERGMGDTTAAHELIAKAWAERLGIDTREAEVERCLSYLAAPTT